MILLPTVEFPPTSFGTRDNPYSNILVDTTTSDPVTANILMAYFTRAGTELAFTGDRDKFKQMKVNTAFR